MKTISAISPDAIQNESEDAHVPYPRTPGGRPIIPCGPGAVAGAAQTCGTIRCHPLGASRAPLLMETAALTQFPDELTRVPGLLNDITDWIEQNDPYPNRPLAFAAAMTTISFAASGKYRFMDVGPELRILAIGPSGFGKAIAFHRALAFLRCAGMGDSIYSGFASPGAVRDLRSLGKPILWYEEHFDQWTFRDKRSAAILDAAFDDNGHPVVFHGQCTPEGFDNACRDSRRFLDFAAGCMIIDAAPQSAARVHGNFDAVSIPNALIDGIARLRNGRERASA